jgi:hypothetical protein
MTRHGTAKHGKDYRERRLPKTLICVGSVARAVLALNVITVSSPEPHVIPEHPEHELVALVEQKFHASIMSDKSTLRTETNLK